MTFKKIFMLICLLICLFAMASVCASDANDTAMASEDTGEIELSQDSEIEHAEDNLQTDEKELMAQANNEERINLNDNATLQDKLGDNEGTYYNLKDEIGSGGDKNLAKSYYRYTGGDAIKITTPGVINGNGAVIDMAGSSIRAFYVNASDVTIKNLAIKNVNFEGNGGAICFNGSGTVENCYFANNSVSYEVGVYFGYTGNGGAVYFSGSGNVANCNFTNNTANGDGGAIYFEKECNGTVTNCNFNNNTVYGDFSGGGAIAFYVEGNGITEILNCNFTNNKALSGGAIYYPFCNGNIANCNFDNNYGNRGGAIFLNRPGSVKNCNFTNNKGYYGGAIIMDYSEVTNCNFIGNSAYSGSAIDSFFFSGSTISNSCFLNNKANAKGLEVTQYENNIIISLIGCNNFLNAINVVGDIIFSNLTYWGGNGRIVNTDSSNPVISYNAPGQNITLEIFGDGLVENVTLITDDNGQAVYDCSKLNDGTYKYKAYHLDDIYYTHAEREGTFIKGLGDFVLLQRYINEADANSVLTLYRNYTYSLYRDVSLTEGIVIDKPITINGNGYTINALQNARIFNITSDNVVLNNITFANAIASGNGGAVYFNSSGSVINCNFTNNIVTNGVGGAVYFNSSGSVINCNFTDNIASGNGGAVYFSSSDNVTNCNFTSNKASNGGAVYFSSSGNVTNCNFTDNSAAEYGGAIHFSSSGNVTNCNFTDNNAHIWGGAVSFGVHGNTLNCNFTGNKLTRFDSWGGAVYFSGSGNVANCNFTDNTASRDGGAVYFSGVGNATNCNFANNNNGNKGGAVYFNSVGNVRNCNFDNNKGNFDYKYGGGVYFNDVGNVTNCNFTNHYFLKGGAVYFKSGGSVRNCNFDNNNASEDGGAVYFAYFTNGDVTNCNFTNNNVFIYYGGAISIYTGNVRNCNFANNTACKVGGAIAMEGGNVTNCNFTDNKANQWGGAVWISWGAAVNCNFVNNSANCGDGGALYFSLSASVENCNFTGNDANRGSAIYISSDWTSKYVSNSCLLNNRANAEALEVTKNENNITIIFKGNNNLLNAIYSNGDVAFTNVTYWGVNGIANTDSSTPFWFNMEAGQNITVCVVVNDVIVLSEVKVTDENGMIVLDMSVGENYFIGVRHDTDSYYTEAEKSISNNTRFNVNVTSQAINNRTVNITAKSNIPNEAINGELLFILSNGDSITANYACNGTWWALYTFYNFAVYTVSASYAVLDNVTINNGTITITIANATINLDNVVLNYGDSIEVNAITEGALAIKAMIDGESVGVIKFAIPISGLNVGNHTLTVTAIPDQDHVAVTKTVNITVNKADSTLTVDNIAFDYKGIGSTTVSYAGATGITASVAGHDEAIVNVDGNTITVSNLTLGIYNLTVTAIADANHNNVTKTAEITVNKAETQLTASAAATFYNVGKMLVATLKDSSGIIKSAKVTIKVGTISKTLNTNSEGQVSVDISSLVPKTYTASIKFAGNANYKASTKSVKVTVKKSNTKLVASGKSFTVKATKKITAILKDSKNRIIKNRYVTFKVAGKTYKVKTNSKGVATATVKITKKGSFSTAVSFAGDAYYNKCSKAIKITVK